MCDRKLEVRKWVRHKYLMVLWLLIFTCVSGVFSANKECRNDTIVCNITYTGYPEDLQDTSIVVPQNIVALNNYIFVGSPVWVSEEIFDDASIFFIIDHSGSMFEEYAPSIDPDAPYDRWGNRFNVIRDLIDTLYQRFPKAEVGFAVFRQWLYHFLDDDPIFANYLGEKYWGYLPLFRLDSVYTPPGQKGYEILKNYLLTDTVKLNTAPFWDYVDLKYIPTDINWNERVTNINTAFEAAKHAFTFTQHAKKDHYIIFISDGKASWPDDGSEDDYIEGEDVPTSFTIYFTKGNTAPQSLQDMTENIKTNGYSSSNPLSELWAFDNTSYDTLMNFIIKNIINSINLIQISNPQNIVVNGNINPIDPWDSVGFTFSKFFPLTGDTTDFVFDVEYIMTIDTINDDGETTTVVLDTTSHVEFDVIIKANAVLDSLYIVNCWKRTLGFYYNGNPITLVDETMEEVEIRFAEEEVDIEYGYKDVSVELTNMLGKKKNDKETFKLSDEGSYLSHTFPREIDSTVDEENGTLTHSILDTFVAVFRNPDLPLDTLLIKIPFKVSYLIEVKGGYYFDNDADGYIDSIFVVVDVDEELTNAHVNKLKDLITLPNHRGFENVEYSLTDGGLAINVDQKDKSSPTKMVTYVTDKDILIIEEAILSIGGWVKGNTVNILDRVAPIIMRAHLIDYQDNLVTDTLTVVFSEPVLKVTKHKPFYFKSMKYGGDLYTVDLRLDSVTDDTTIVFYLLSIEGINNEIDRMWKGDSIWIYWEDEQVGDDKFNFQDNEGNRRRMLTAERKLIPFELIPHVVSPVNFNDLNKLNVIDSSIINILDPENKVELEMINGKYIGMLLQVVAVSDKKLSNLILEGNVSIFDPVGNQVIKKRKMGFSEKTNSLNYAWNGSNSNGRSVGTGTYLVVFEVTPIVGDEKQKLKKEVKRKFIGVKE